jgi:hypothetical protein
MRSTEAPATRYEVIEPEGRVLFWIWALCVVLPLSITAMALGMMVMGADNHATPASGTALVLIAAGVLVTVVPLAIVLQRSLRRLLVSFDGHVLEMRVAWYRLRVTVAEIDVAHARIANLDEHVELRPSLKTNAFMLPGYQAGYFRLRDWRRKAFLMLTSRQRVLVLPLHDKRTILLSLRQPQKLVDALRAAAA